MTHGILSQAMEFRFFVKIVTFLEIHFKTNVCLQFSTNNLPKN